MDFIVFLLAGATGVLLVLIEAVRPQYSSLSLFELRRRQKAGDKKASEQLHREELIRQASMLKTPLKATLFACLVLLLVRLADIGQVALTAVVFSFLYARVAGLKPVQKAASTLYRRYEQKLLAFIEKYQKPIRLLAGKARPDGRNILLGSREEFARLLETAPIFSADDRKLLESALGFSDKTVGDYMVKRAAVVTVKPDELLGPLVLDDLHKTKHEIFPVEDNGTVVGMLDIRDHVALRRAESVYVRDVMHTGVVRINQSELLDEALRVLVAAKQPYLIVIDDDDQMVGLLGLGDVIHELTGWKRR